jgi:MinD-like ATPase involved in chromosome partitioning or flagellar assembly
MIHLLLFEKNTKLRTELLLHLTAILTSEACIGVFKDRVDITAVLLDDWKQQTPPSLIFLGPETAKNSPEEIAKARNRFPKAALIVLVEESSLLLLQHFALYGAQNILGIHESTAVLFGSMLSVLNRTPSGKKGKLLVVDSGKGGVGLTTFVAALGSYLSQNGSVVTLLDLDFESQDLTRFLQVRPYVNEALEVIIAHETLLNVEQVNQCCQKVWEGETLTIVPPAPAYEGLLKGSANHFRQLKGVIEIIDSQTDVTIIDIAGIPAVIAKRLYEIADNIIYLINLDPCTIHASVCRIKLIIDAHDYDQRILLVPVANTKESLGLSDVRKEFEKIIKIKGAVWTKKGIPYLPKIKNWPASGSSPIEFGSFGYKAVFIEIGEILNLVELAPIKQVEWVQLYTKAQDFLKYKVKLFVKSSHNILENQNRLDLLLVDKQEKVVNNQLLITAPILIEEVDKIINK